jgi:hypothetical protein
MKAAAALVLALASSALVACRSAVPIEVPIEIAGVAAIPPGSFDEIVVTDFEAAAPLADLAVGRELRDYLAAEIRRAFRGPVMTAGSADEALSRPKERAIVISGSVTLAGEVRKALDKSRVPLDGPFKTAGRGLVELRHWALTVDLSVRSAADGATLFRRVFREERDYIDLEKPADFAFSELAERVRARLLPLLLGTATRESRTLLGR